MRYWTVTTLLGPALNEDLTIKEWSTHLHWEAWGYIMDDERELTPEERGKLPFPVRAIGYTQGLAIANCERKMRDYGFNVR